MTAPRTPPPRPTVHFQGRGRELDAALRALARYPVVLVTGLAGIGKTTLAARIASEFQKDGETVWTRVRAEGGGDGLLADLARMLELEPAPEEDAAARSLAVLGALERLGNGRPAVLFVDDLHLADDAAGRTLVGTVLRYARHARLVGTARVAPEVPAVEDLEVFTLPLVGLGEEDAIGLLASVLGESASGEVSQLARSLHQRTGGHPHFLKLLGSHLATSGSAGLKTATPAALPELEDFLRREVVDALPREEARALATLAVLDGPVPAPLAEAAAGDLEKGWQRAVRSLVRRGLVEQGANAMLDLHAQVREASLAGLPARERAEIEGRAGAEILKRSRHASPQGDPAMELAAYGHLLRAGEAPRVAREIPVLMERAHRGGHHAAILTLLDALLRDAGRLPPELWVQRARVLKLRGSYDEALASLQPLLEDAPKLLAHLVQSEIGDIHNLSGDYEKARAHYELALEHAKALDDVGAQVDAESNLASLLFYQGQSAAAERIYRKALARSRELSDHAREAMTLNNLAAVLRQRCKLREAEELYRECLVLDEATGDRTGSARTFHNLGVVYMMMDRPADAVREFGRSLELKEKIGFGPGMANTLRHLAEVTLASGDTAAARSHIERAATYLGRGDRLLGSALEGTRAMIELADGSPARAREALQRALAACPGETGRRVQAGLYRRLAEVAVAAGEAAEALAWCAQSLAAQTKMDETSDLVRLHRLGGHAALMAGDLPAARAELEKARKALPTEGLTGDRAWVSVLELAQALRAPTIDADAMKTAVPKVARSGDVGAHLAARRILAAAYERAGQDDAAREERARYLEIAHGAPGGALPALARAEAIVDRVVPDLPRTFVIADAEGDREAGAAEVGAALAAAGQMPLVLDMAQDALLARGQPVAGFFGKKVQVALLGALMRAGPRAMTKSALYEAAWKARYNAEFHDNTLYVRINQLRKILEPLVGTDPIQTQSESATYRIAPGLAYLLVAPR